LKLYESVRTKTTFFVCFCVVLFVFVAFFGLVCLFVDLFPPIDKNKPEKTNLTFEIVNIIFQATTIKTHEPIMRKLSIFKSLYI